MACDFVYFAYLYAAYMLNDSLFSLVDFLVGELYLHEKKCTLNKILFKNSYTYSNF